MRNRPRFDLDGLVRPNASGLEASQCARIIRPVLAECKAHYQFPIFRFDCILSQTARIILCKTSPFLIWFWLTVSGLGQTDLVRRQANVQASLSLLLASASELIWIGHESDPACSLGIQF